MRLKIHLAFAFVSMCAGMCAGCDYDARNAYSQPNRSYGYLPGYPQPNELYGYAPGYAPDGYSPSYSPYGYAPSYHQPAPSLGLGFGYFGGGARRNYGREEWHEHQEQGRERRGGFHQPPAALNTPPPAANVPPPAFHPTTPPIAHSVPSAAANAAALDRLGFRANRNP
jgi:hypothetical protein